MAQPNKFSNQTQSKNAQCKIVVYPWLNVLDDTEATDEALSKSGRLDVSSQVTSCTFSKNMGQAAGTFSFTLSNSPGIGTQDWKDIIKRGYWCVIYMTNEGDLILNPQVGSNLATNKSAEAKRIRGLCYIDRVSVKMTIGENREMNYEWEVTGRDFGVIYEETEIWHNLFQFDEIMLTSIRDSQMNITGNTRIHEALELIHNLFFFPSKIPGAKVNDDKSLLSIGLQWLMPREMLIDVGFNLSTMTGGTYWGNLPDTLRFSETGAGIAIDKPTDFLSGNAWEQLKRLSIPQFHELFCETNDDGKPKLIFRPIPWGINQSKYEKNKKFVKLYKDLKFIKVPAIDVIDLDLGEDDHNRYNSFLATVTTTMISTADNISLTVGSDFPKNNKASIRRHGFRPMHVAIDSLVKNEELANGAADVVQLQEYNEILYDYWNQAIFSESGMCVKVGTNDVKIGLALKFNNDVAYVNSRRYYIEGYTDQFVVNEKGASSWVQNVVLTRGFEEADLSKGTGFGNRDVEFKFTGEYTKRNGK